jgi:hypothetical protein
MPPLLVAAPAINDDACDYITVEELLQDMPNGADGGDDGQEATLREPEDV